MQAGEVRVYRGTTTWEAALLEDTEGNADSGWFFVGGVFPIGFSITGVMGDTVQLRGSLARDEPLPSDDGEPLHADITANRLGVIELPVKWLKAKVVWGSGSVTVRGYGYYRI